MMLVMMMMMMMMVKMISIVKNGPSFLSVELYRVAWDHETLKFRAKNVAASLFLHDNLTFWVKSAYERNIQTTTHIF